MRINNKKVHFLKIGLALLILGLGVVGFSEKFISRFNSGIVYAEEKKDEAKKLTDEKKKAISQNCISIKTSLSQLQKVDSRARVYLGTAYEKVFSKFMIPLNVRLTKNGMPSTTLTAIQSEFGGKRNNFTSKFTDYMKKSEELTQFDCQTKPEEFYEKLEKLRVQRKELNGLVTSLNGLVDKQITEVKKIEEGL